MMPYNCNPVPGSSLKISIASSTKTLIMALNGTPKQTSASLHRKIMMICWESKKNDKIVKSHGALPRNFQNYLTYWILHLPVNLINKINLKLDSPVWQFVIQMKASHLNNAPINSTAPCSGRTIFQVKGIHNLFHVLQNWSKNYHN